MKYPQKYWEQVPAKATAIAGITIANGMVEYTLVYCDENNCWRHVDGLPLLIEVPPDTIEYRRTRTATDRVIPPQYEALAAGRVIDIPEGYEGLFTTLYAAFEQAAHGKGHERHASDGVPFEEQSAQQICNLLGTADGMAHQAIKKINEARGLPHARMIAELHGAIIYIAGMIIWHQQNAALPTDSTNG